MDILSASWIGSPGPGSEALGTMIQGEYDRAMRRIRRAFCVRLLILGLALGLAILWLW